jgi:hypothetical protein
VYYLLVGVSDVTGTPAAAADIAATAVDNFWLSSVTATTSLFI